MPEHEHQQRLVKDLLLEALERPAEDRPGFLHKATADAAVRRHVMSLLDAHEQAGAFLDKSPSRQDLEHIDADDAPGGTIGRYRLLRLIGEGGFGRVYLAEQREPIVRQVALKIIKLGMDTRQVIKRFEAERQTLALMEHPGIARVLDAGADPRGRPYFVMELVDGVPITTYCDAHRLNIPGRLRLFMQVCAAVQHAHAKGIVHRDLKPGNMLVHDAPDGPLATVIDFGIAKAMAGRSAQHTLLTEQQQLVGTPEYMSPEQIESHSTDVDTRSDVYSLGVVLYELLTGSTPFDPARPGVAAYADMQRFMLDRDPDTPSTRLSKQRSMDQVAARRDSEPRRLLSQLRGDLDWITLKAMEKDRERRYVSPAELAQDLRRHLTHEPVTAGPQRAGYRVRKFVRRHRVTVVAGLSIALALVAGVIVATTGLVRAREAAARAQDAADQAVAINDFMREFLTSVDPDEGGADVTVMEVLDEASIAAGQRFANHPELEARVRTMLGQVNMRLTRLGQAETEYRRVEDLWRQAAGPDDPRTLEARVNVAMTLSGREDGRAAEEYLVGVLPRLEQALGPAHTTTLHACGIMGEVLRLRGRLDDSEALLRKALARCEGAAVEDHAVLGLQNALTATLGRKVERATPIESRAAVDAYGESAARLMELAVRQGQRGRWYVRAARLNLADIAVIRGEWSEAAAQTRALLDETASTLGQCHSVRSAAMIMLAQAESRLGRPGEAAELYLRAIDCTRGATGSEILLLVHLSDALPALDRAQRWSDGERCVREILDQIQRMGPGHIGAMRYQAYLAHFISRQGRIDEAQSMFDALLAQPPDEAAAAPRLSLAYADHLIRLGRFEEAEHKLHELAGSPVAAPYFPEEYPGKLLMLYRAWGQDDKVVELQRQHDEIIRMAATQAITAQ